MAYSYVWPGTLPTGPNASSYSETPGTNILRSPMDAGPAKMRRRGVRPDTLGVSYAMTDAQVSTLKTFVETTIQGTARFGWPHPRTGATVEARIVPTNDGGLYSIAYVSEDYWLVSLTVEVLP